MKNDHEAHSSSLENQIYLQASRIAELEKSQKSLQNEKAVLNTAVEIRESKLAKMSELQASLDMLSSKVAKSEALKTEFVEMSTKYGDLCRDLEELAASEKECRSQLAIADRRMDEFNREVQSNRQKRQKCQVELMQIQAKTQTLMSERNAYKQKADSLTKEISRLCKNGLSIVDIERIIADENARRTEIEILKTQKRQALEDLNEYRTAYQQQLVSSLKAGVQGESLKAMQQNAELERVVADLTEYVTAKEMQMETLKQVNETLSQELKLLAHANMSKDEI
mmetsp:Transcript_24170/g.34611  ORF Transcript_24170/g.34611 Transcript_24170/m.34611 type:complete len:282 (+) Transcript_24170:95-940(+)